MPNSRSLELATRALLASGRAGKEQRRLGRLHAEVLLKDEAALTGGPTRMPRNTHCMHSLELSPVCQSCRGLGMGTLVVWPRLQCRNEFQKVPTTRLQDVDIKKEKNGSSTSYITPEIVLVSCAATCRSVQCTAGTILGLERFLAMPTSLSITSNFMYCTGLLINALHVTEYPM